jgi:hypothetical protein
MIKFNNQTFIERCKEIHGDAYDYSILEFKRLRDPVLIICKKHGEFTQRAQSHIMGSGCKICYNNSRNPTYEQFINKANLIHNSRYSYIEYNSMKKKATIACSTHGDFKQMAYKHLLGQGCPLCSRELSRLGINDFIERSSQQHENVYDYSKVNYINHSTKVSIICSKHGEFLQTPNNHLIHSKGCPKCSRNISKMETKWLDSMYNNRIIRQFKIVIDNKIYNVDGYDPDNMTIYEFYGDFWHGNLNIYNRDDFNVVSKIKFGDLYDSVSRREKTFIENGYIVISIWENDFKIKKSNENIRNRTSI